MKRNVNFIIAIVIVCFTQGCTQDSPYDTSTPEKFIIALGQIGERPKEENPIPFFYAKEDAIAITEFDETGAQAIEAFQAFKSAIASNFPNNIKSNVENKIVLEEYKMGPLSLSFSLSASLIRSQIQSRKAGDYKFISATEPDENGTVEITFLLLGNQSKLEVTKFGNQYMLTSKEENTKQLIKMVDFFNQAGTFFSSKLAIISNKEVTSENLMEKATLWQTEYMGLQKILK